MKLKSSRIHLKRASMLLEIGSSIISDVKTSVLRKKRKWGVIADKYNLQKVIMIKKHFHGRQKATKDLLTKKIMINVFDE